MKRYITAMSHPRKKCLERFESVAKELNDHIIECVVYKDMLPDALDHWCQEIGAWLNYVNGTSCTTKLKESDYVNTLFSEFGDEVHDAKFNLALYQLNNSKLLKKHSDDAYPDFEVTDDLARELAHIYANILNLSLPILMSDEVLSANEWALKVRNLL